MVVLQITKIITIMLSKAIVGQIEKKHDEWWNASTIS